MERTNQIFMLVFCLLLALTACTKKDNLTGDNFSDVRPQSFFYQGFDLGFSFGDSIQVKGNEKVLLCGHSGGVEAVTVLHFNSLPKDFVIPESKSYQDSTWIQLSIIRKNASLRNSTVLQLYSLEQHWLEDAAHELDLSAMTPIGETFTVPDSIGLQGTVVKVPIPVEFLNQLSAAQKDSLSIGIKAVDDDTWCEMDSRSTGKGPRLAFKYQKPETKQMLSFDMLAARDSYIVNGPQSTIQADKWVINNLHPSRIYVHWLDDWSLFKDMDGNTLDEVSRKRVTINKAELIFHLKENPYYKAGVSYSLRPIWVEKDSIEIAMQLTGSDLGSAALPTTGFVRGDSMVVDITPFMQGYTNGKKPNKGIVIKSEHEMQSFGYMEFYHFTAASKKPKLRVVYTVPWL